MSTNSTTGPMVPQGQITRTVSVSESIGRTIADSQSANPGKRFPGGGERLHHIYSKNDPLIGCNKDVLYQPGRPQETAIPSLNGLDLSPYPSIEDAERDYHFIGVNKTDHDPMNPQAPKNGIATTSVGTADPPWTSLTDTAYPGDDITWRFPTEAEAARPHHYDGKPKGKSLPILEVMKWDDIDNLEHRLVHLALKDTNRGGVADLQGDVDPNLTHIRQTAYYLKRHANASALFIVEALLREGRVQLVTPESSAALRSSLDAENDLGQLRSLLGLKPDGALKPDTTDVLLNEGKNQSQDIMRPKDMINNHPALTAAQKQSLSKEVDQSQDRALLWLSSVLSVVPSRTVKPDVKLQKVVVSHLYPNSAFNNGSGQAATSRGPRLPSNYWTSNETQANYGQKLANQYQQASRDFQVDYKIVMAELMNSKLRKKIGTSVCMIGPKANNKISLILK